MSSPFYKNSNNSLNSFSNEKSKKMNQFIIDTIEIFNIKYNVLNTDLLNLKNEFIKQMNIFQNLINEDNINIKKKEINYQYKKVTTNNIQKITFE